jgi:predicted Rdx family selenoprotein
MESANANETQVRPLQTGSVSHGTHRPEDLIPAFSDELATQQARTQTDQYDDLIAEANAVTDFLESLETVGVSAETWIAQEALSTLVETLQDALSGFSEDYIYFGTHPGDGSDFGFWVDSEAVERDREDGELPAGDELPEGNSGLFLVVSDHGNMTLYDGAREVWGVV